MLAQVAQPADPPTPVVALVRVSTAEQAAEGRAGIARQREAIARIIAAKNLHCLQVYELVDVSGTQTESHPTIQEIIRRVRSGEAKGLVCSDLDRAYRPDTPSSGTILQVFQDTGSLIWTSSEVYNLRTASGLLFSSVRGAIAGYELFLIKERQHGAKEAKRRLGRMPTNYLTLPRGVGYDRKAEKFFYTAEIANVRKLFDLFDGGLHNYSELARLTGCSGPASVRVILSNVVYTGWRVYNLRRGEKRVSKLGKTYRVKERRPEEDIIRVQVLEPVVSQEMFERIQREMAQVKRNFIANHRMGTRVNLNAGIARCSHCGESLQIVSGKRSGGRTRRGAYVCKSQHYLYKARLGGCKQPNLPNDEFDEATSTLAATILSDPKNLARMLQQNLEQSRERVIPFAGVLDNDRLQSDLKKRDARLLEAYEAGAITVDELKMKRAALRKEAETLTQMQQPRSTPQHDDFLRTARMVVKAAIRFRAIKESIEKKRIIQSLFDAVFVRDKYIVSFKLKENALNSQIVGQNGIVTLSKPIPIGREKEPEGHRRCIRCESSKPLSEFYRNLHRCNPCRKEEERARHVKRKEQKAQAKKAAASLVEPRGYHSNCEE